MANDVKTAQIQKIITSLLGELSTRQRDVLHKRFGLKDGKRRTLEEIGGTYQITRERVRQIENDAKSAVLRSQMFKALDSFFQSAIEYFERFGGIRAEHRLFEDDVTAMIPNISEKKIAKSYLYFLLSLHDAFVKHPENDMFHTVWALKTTDPVEIKNSVASLIKKLDETKELIGRDRLLALLRGYVGNLEEHILESYLDTAKPIGANVFGEYGLKHWPEVSTRGVRDKAYLVLKKHGKPLHFREIVNHINKTFKLKKQAHPQTVHNELIKNDRFVLVGRGMYALSDWGFEPGRVADVMAQILKGAGRPLSREEIIDEVLKRRNVKLNTILLNLQNKDYFEKMEDGRFSARA